MADARHHIIIDVDANDEGGGVTMVSSNPTSGANHDKHDVLIMAAGIGNPFGPGSINQTQGSGKYNPRQRLRSQNSTINYNRKVEIDAYYNLDLRDADYIFNSQEVKPVIQFVYEINYGFIKRDREEEARIKEARKMENQKKKTIKYQYLQKI